jgi:hypothetical protein
MSFYDFAEWIRHLWLFTLVRESSLLYPIILSTHLSIIGVFGGLIVTTDLRLLGVVLTRYSIATVIRQLRPYKWVGLILMICMGILLAGSKANIYYDNPYFLIKISTLLLIGVHFLIFRRAVYRDETVPAADGPKTTGIAKLAGVTSLVLWITIVVCGRWIAYYDRPDDEKLRPDAARLVIPKIRITPDSVAGNRSSDVRADR